MNHSQQQELADLLQKDAGLILSPQKNMEDIRTALANHVNQLINTDFDRLVSLLYRIDVPEKKMRYLLEQQQGENAPLLIADLIIERQLQKIESRKQFKKDDPIPDDEKW
ncbi:MAG TPA: hypothetical protein PLO99_11325 [Chitinophagaceae bacterium]|jgi:hypothetical protein|nr:hypothetical protein [Chitinophagaceae bacterium]HRG93771.1 hypothetical protein [Chitinophagaceae bacterium]